MKIGIKIEVALCAFLTTVASSGPTRAADTCSAYPAGQAEEMSLKDLDAKLGEIPKPTRPLRFAYVTKTLINEAFQAMAQGVRDEAAKYGVTVDVQAAKDESSFVEQLNMAQTVLSRKPDALLISPESDSNLGPVIKAAKEANIPSIVLDDARSPNVSTYIGTDQVAIGAEAGKYLHRRYPDGGKIAQIEGQAGSPNARKRIQGFEDEVKKYPNLILVASQPGNWDRLTALNATANILRQHPDLIGIYANNDGMALGVVEAVRSAGKLKQVAIVGTDGINAAKRSIESDGMATTISEFTYDEGRYGVQAALRIIACQPVPAWIISPQGVLTADNVKDFPDPPPYKN